MDSNSGERQDALALLHEYTKSESLRKHALAVEIALRFYARYFGEDENLWGLTGLLHDFDYEAHPGLTDHTVVGGKILRQRGYPEEMLHAIEAHNEGNGLNVKRTTLLDKTLFACDELAGFITAVALIRPSKSLYDLKPKSVKKKFKEKHFAASVSRDDIRQGIVELQVDEDEHIARVIDAMCSIADQLGLEGSVGKRDIAWPQPRQAP